MRSVLIGDAYLPETSFFSGHWLLNYTELILCRVGHIKEVQQVYFYSL